MQHTGIAAERIELVERSNLVLRHPRRAAARAERACEVLAALFRSPAKQAGGHEFEVQTLRALRFRQQKRVCGLLDSGKPRAEGVHDVRDEHLFAARVRRRLVRVADHDRHDAEKAANLLDLEAPRLQMLRIEPRHGLRQPFRAPIEDHRRAGVLRAREFLVDPGLQLLYCSGLSVPSTEYVPEGRTPFACSRAWVSSVAIDSPSASRASCMTSRPR
jgi:hypothetical protein